MGSSFAIRCVQDCATTFVRLIRCMFVPWPVESLSTAPYPATAHVAQCRFLVCNTYVHNCAFAFERRFLCFVGDTRIHPMPTTSLSLGSIPSDSVSRSLSLATHGTQPPPLSCVSRLNRLVTLHLECVAHDCAGTYERRILVIVHGGYTDVPLYLHGVTVRRGFGAGWQIVNPHLYL